MNDALYGLYYKAESLIIPNGPRNPHVKNVRNCFCLFPLYYNYSIFVFVEEK